MKIRNGFVSNSSSTAFMITNLTDQVKTLVDFVAETPWIIEEYIERYDIGPDEGISQGNLMISAEENNITFEPHESKVCYFGDEQGTLIGAVYDYMLRGEDISESAQLLDRVNSTTDPTEAQKLGQEWLASLGDPSQEDKFTGVDSLSFKVRFHAWCR